MPRKQVRRSHAVVQTRPAERPRSRPPYGGFTPVDNWRGDDSMFARIYTAIRKLTDCPASDAIIRDLDIYLLMDHNVQQTRPRAQAKRRGIEYQEGFSKLNLSKAARAIGRDRKNVVAPTASAVFKSGLHETRKAGNRIEFKPRAVDAARAEAFAAFLETHGRFPTEDWWKVGTTSPQSVTPDITGLTSGTSSPPPATEVGSTSPVLAERWGATPQLSAHEEVRRIKEKNSSPSPALSHGSGSGTDGRPADHHPDGGAEDLALGEDGMGYGCADCHRGLDVATVARIRERIATGEEDIAWAHSSGPRGRCPNDIPADS